jgi:alpha-N-arabinofuranosidase
MMTRLSRALALSLWTPQLISMDCPAADQPVRVQVDAGSPKWTISKYLTGSHFVYAFERDSLHEDERIAEWMRRAKIGVIRWPGGTAVQTYHWDDLNGIAFKVDSWAPGYTEKAAEPSEHMDLDEYIAYCRRVGAEPMVGVNILSGKKYSRDADGLDEARRLIAYCRDKNYGVKYWYIGNECYKGFGAKRYIEYIDRYAEVLRSVVPDIAIVADWKFGPESKGRFEECLEIATKSKHVDILEIHEKWGNEWGLASGMTVEDWRNEFPLYNGKLGDYMRKFHDGMKAAGRPQVKLGFNEWGVGGVKGGDKFDNALVAADFMIEMFRNRVEQACYWNLNMGSGNSQILHTASDRHELVELNPIAHVFEMFAHALEKPLLPVASSQERVYGFAVKDTAADAIRVFLLNKSDAATSVEIDVANAGFDGAEVRVESFVSPGNVVALEPVIYEAAQRPTVSLEAYSFNAIVVEER